MRGKDKCKILKEIRQKIADENDIEFVTSECTHKGNCKGTCPKCEAEVRYLEKQLAKKRSIGNGVKIAAVAAAIPLVATGCTPAINNIAEFPSAAVEFISDLIEELKPTIIEPLEGDVPNIIEMDGEIEETSEYELEGDPIEEITTEENE